MYLSNKLVLNNLFLIFIDFFHICIRYAIQLLKPSSQNAKMNGHGSILQSDIIESESIFMHAKESAKVLKKHAKKFMK